jgi:hypothetical protein
MAIFFFCKCTRKNKNHLEGIKHDRIKMHLNDCWSYTVMHKSMYAEHPLMWNDHVNVLYFFPQFFWKKYSLINPRTIQKKST